MLGGKLDDKHVRKRVASELVLSTQLASVQALKLETAWCLSAAGFSSRASCKLAAEAACGRAANFLVGSCVHATSWGFRTPTVSCTQQAAWFAQGRYRRLLWLSPAWLICITT